MSRRRRSHRVVLDDVDFRTHVIYCQLPPAARRLIRRFVRECARVQKLAASFAATFVWLVIVLPV